MGLLDLKSDLSKYRKPAPTTDLKKEAKTLDKNFGSKNPLADMARNLQKPESFQQTDTKEGKNIVNESSLSGRNETSTVQIGETDKTFKREGIDPTPMPDPTPKEGKTLSDQNATPEKTGVDAVTPTPTPEKSGQEVTGGPLTFERKGTDVDNTSALQGRHLSAGDGLQANQIGIGDYFKNTHADGFTPNFQGPNTQFKIGTSEFSNYGSLMIWDGIKNQDANGFTPFMQSTQYKGISGQTMSTMANSQYKVGGNNSPQTFIDGHSGTIVTGNKKGFQPTGIDNVYSNLDTYGNLAYKNDSPHIIGSLSYLNSPYSYVVGNSYSSKVP
ncbi:MAG TPA: hypothetical protein DF712_14155, partial [Balneola sp.]|nr:hypothetical protein [Balneola sp.]